MSVRVETTAHYAADPDKLFDHAIRFGELADAMKGLAVYDGLPAGVVAEGDTYLVDVSFWGGVLKTKNHRIHVARLDRSKRRVESLEANEAVPRWDHTLTVEASGDGAVWRDSVVIDAGWRTWFITRLAGYIYRHRHRNRGAGDIATIYRRAT